MPALGETWWAARGLGCFRDGERVEIREVRRWEEATLSLGEMRALLEPPHGQAVLELIKTARRVRCYGDVAGVRMVLRGEADLWLEAGVKVWDLAALQVLVEEAGGRFTDFAGRRTIEGGRAVAGGAGLHAHAVRVLGG